MTQYWAFAGMQSLDKPPNLHNGNGGNDKRPIRDSRMLLA